MINEEDIFAAAAALPTAARSSFLDAACGGQPEMRARIEALLRSHDCSGFMDQPIGAAPDAVTLPIGENVHSEQSGDRIGRYKLLQGIGEGGFGRVWMAEQVEPVTRRVALKILKAGMDTKEVIARFEAERQALAMMDHPNIAKVHDAGATDKGRPFFVMELVKGIPITQFCDEQMFSTRERIELFVDVCSAVNHAHQKGVIHRDLKPSNVLVTLHGDKPVPKVIDFGIAKATGGRLTDKTLFTRFEQFVGTPAYMSPEQTALSGLDVDTRADIYGLGILLYELLTGTPPFDTKSLLSAGYEEMRRIIREVEPPKPSTRLNTALGEERTFLAKSRRISTEKLNRLVEPELDWIVMKAIEKDRTRRYETANGLAADLRRHLRDEPVLAGPPSLGYRARKFVRRHRAGVSIAAGFLVLLALTAGVSTWLAIWANLERAKAKASAASEAIQRRRAELAAEGEARERRRAEQGQEAARNNLYVAQINLARQAWREGNGVRLLELLEAQNPQGDEADLRGFEWRYLWRLCHRAEVVRSVGSQHSTFSSDGRLMAFLDDPHSSPRLTVCDVASGEATGSLRVPEPPSRDIKARHWHTSFSPDGKFLVVGGSDYHRQRDGFSFLGHWPLGSIPKPGQVSPKTRATSIIVSGIPTDVSMDGSAVPGFVRYEPGANSISSVACSPDGRWIAAGTENPGRTNTNGSWTGNDWSDQRVLIFSTESKSVAATLSGNVGDVDHLAFSPDGRILASASTTMIKLWEVESWRDLGTLTKGTAMSGWVNAIAFAPDGASIAAAAGFSNSSGAVEIWDWQTKTNLTSITQKSGVNSLAYSPDGTKLASSSGSGIFVWNAAAADLLAFHTGHTANIHALSYGSGGRVLVSAGGDKTLRWSQPNEGEGQSISRGKRDAFDRALGFSPGGQVLASALFGTLRLLDLSLHVERIIETGHTDQVERVDFSADGAFVATLGSEDGTLKLWDAQTGTMLNEHADPDRTDRSSSIAFSPNGRLLAWASDKTVKLLEVPALDNPVIYASGSDQKWDYLSVAFSPDGELVSACGWDGVVVWDVRTRRIHQTYKNAEGVGLLGLLTFSPDGGSIAAATTSSGMTDAVIVWDLEAQSRRFMFRGRGVPFEGLRFSLDGKTLATADDGGTITLLHAGNGQVLFSVESGAEHLSDLTFTADGKAMVIANQNRVTWWRATDPNPDSTEAHVIVSEQDEESGNFSESADALKPVLDQNPEIGGLWERRAVLLEKAGRLEEGYKDLTKAIELAIHDPSPDAARRELLLKRSELLKRLNRPAEALSDGLLARGIPRRVPGLSPALIDISEYYNAGLTESWHTGTGRSDLSALVAGAQLLAGVEFDVRGLIQVGGFSRARAEYPARVNGIRVGRSCRRLHFLHSAILGKETAGNPVVGEYAVRYVDGQIRTIPIVFGRDVINWSSHPGEDLTNVTIAWDGQSEADKQRQRHVRLCKTTWENPLPGEIIKEIDFAAGPVQAKPFLVAITVEP